MAHVSATIPWEEGKEEDFVELREGLEKLRTGEILARESSSESEGSDEGQGDAVEYHKYEATDSEDSDDDEDPGGNKPEERLLWAAQHNHLSLATDLISAMPELVYCKDSDLYTGLHRAAYNNHTDMIQIPVSYTHLTLPTILLV